MSVTFSFGIPQNQYKLMLGYTSPEMGTIQRFLDLFIKVFRSDESPFHPPAKGILFKYHGSDFKLAADIDLIYTSDRNIKHIILHLEDARFIIGKGSERVVRRCYDLVTHCFFAEKQVFPLEARFLEHLSQVGAPEVCGFYWRRGEQFVIEKRYEGSLETLLSKSKLTSKSKLLLIHQLFKILKIVHDQKIEAKDQLTDACDQFVFGHYYPIPAFHGDIKPKNILFDKSARHDKQAPTLALTDFSMFDKTMSMRYTNEYLSPEGFNFLQTSVVRGSDNDVLTLLFNRDGGQQRDIWAMGLIATSILEGKLIADTFPPLPSLYTTFANAVDNTSINPYKVQFDHPNLQADLQLLKERAPTEHQALFDLISQMLNADPKQRPTATHTLQVMEYLLCQ